MKNIIISYINTMTKEDIINFVNKKKYKATNKEIDIIYNYIKKHSIEIITDPIKHIETLKAKISNETYNEMIILYNKYKNFIK